MTLYYIQDKIVFYHDVYENKVNRINYIKIVISNFVCIHENDTSNN